MNEIFDPHQSANVFQRESSLREASITADKGTNYGVVRLELLEHIYQNLYTQALLRSSPEHRILRYRTIASVEAGSAGSIRLRCENATALYEKCCEPVDEVLEFDVVILATGYTRDMHIGMLKPLMHLLPEGPTSSTCECMVQEDYRLCLEKTKVDLDKAGIWLQGCNEKTHGVSLAPTRYSSILTCIN